MLGEYIFERLCADLIRVNDSRGGSAWSLIPGDFHFVGGRVLGVPETLRLALIFESSASTKEVSVVLAEERLRELLADSAVQEFVNGEFDLLVSLLATRVEERLFSYEGQDELAV